MRIPDIKSTPEGSKLVKIMAQGLLDYLDSQGKVLPDTYEEFENTVVAESRATGLEGSICFFSPKAQRAFLELVGLPIDFFENLKEWVPRISKDAELLEKLRSANLIGTNGGISNEKRAEGIEKLGPGFKPVADSFRVGFCHRRAVYEAAKLMKEN